MANKRLVSSDILDVELSNKFLLKDTVLRLNTATESKINLDLNSDSGSNSGSASSNLSLKINPNSEPKPNKNTQKNPSQNHPKNQQSKNTIKKLFLPLDGTEIRKAYTLKSEKIDKVRALNGSIINGYHSYSTVAVTENSHQIKILEIKPFSTKEESFLSKNKVILDLIDSTLDGLVELENQKVFLMDREFDSQSIIEHLYHHKYQPKFIIRGKHLNRQFKEGKLNQIKFKKEELFKIKKLEVKNQTHQDLTLKLRQKQLTLVNKYGEETVITVIKSKLLDKDKKPVFKEDEEFCLLTNQEIKTREDLYQTYLNYFIRWKIEVVFKFLKDVLGLESFRIEDLTGIKNLIALTFLVGSYLNDLGKVNISEEFLIWLSKLGDGDGKITPYYLRQGLQAIANYTKVSMLFKREKIPKEKQKELVDMVGW